MGSECSQSCKLENDTLPSSTEFRDHHETPPFETTRTRVGRTSTIFHLEQTDVPKWYINGKFVGSTFQVYQKSVLTELHSLTIAEESQAELIELGNRIVAGCASADGPLTKLEQEMFDTFCKSKDPDTDPSEWLTTSIVNVPILVAEFEGIVADLQEHVMERLESANWVNEHGSLALVDDQDVWDLSSKLQLLFTAIVVSAADGLSRAEINKVYEMADTMRISRERAREMCDCLFLEQELFERFRMIFDLADDDKENSHSDNNLLLSSPLEMQRETTISSLERHDIAPWYLQSEIVGTSIDIWKAYLLQGDPDANLISTNIGFETGFNLVSCKLIAACASADGPLSELEQHRFRKCKELRKVEEKMDVFLNVSFDEIEELLDEWEKKLSETAQLVVGSFSLLWTTPEKLYDAEMLKKIILMEAIAVCAADGLRREEMNVVYLIAASLGVDRLTTKHMTELFVLEQMLFRKYHALFRPDLDESDDDDDDEEKGYRV